MTAESKKGNSADRLGSAVDKPASSGAVAGTNALALDACDHLTSYGKGAQTGPVELNIGGQLFTTSRQTLTMVSCFVAPVHPLMLTLHVFRCTDAQEKDSFFTGLLSGKFEVERDAQGAFSWIRLL